MKKIFTLLAVALMSSVLFAETFTIGGINNNTLIETTIDAEKGLSKHTETIQFIVNEESIDTITRVHIVIDFAETTGYQVGKTFAEANNSLFDNMLLATDVDYVGWIELLKDVDGDFQTPDSDAEVITAGEKYVFLITLKHGIISTFPSDLNKVTIYLNGQMQTIRKTVRLEDDAEFYIDAPEPIENTTAVENGVIRNTEKVSKVLENGQVVLIRDGVRYNVLGTALK